MLILAGGLLTLDSPTDVGLPTLSCGGSVQFLRLQASLKPLRRQMLVGQVRVAGSYWFGTRRKVSIITENGLILNLA